MGNKIIEVAIPPSSDHTHMYIIGVYVQPRICKYGVPLLPSYHYTIVFEVADWRNKMQYIALYFVHAVTLHYVQRIYFDS